MVELDRSTHLDPNAADAAVAESQASAVGALRNHGSYDEWMRLAARTETKNKAIRKGIETQLCEIRAQLATVGAPTASASSRDDSSALREENDLLRVKISELNLSFLEEILRVRKQAEEQSRELRALRAKHERETDMLKKWLIALQRSMLEFTINNQRPSIRHNHRRIGDDSQS